MHKRFLISVLLLFVIICTGTLGYTLIDGYYHRHCGIPRGGTINLFGQNIYHLADHFWHWRWRICAGEFVGVHRRRAH